MSLLISYLYVLRFIIKTFHASQLYFAALNKFQYDKNNDIGIADTVWVPYFLHMVLICLLVL